MNRQNLLTLLATFALLFSFTYSCNAKGKDKAKHVVFIGLDGWGAYSLPKADMPNVKKLMEDGSYTLKKRSALPSSSAINWASMFMGAGPELHGYTEWGSKTPELPSRVLNKNGIFPTCIPIAARRPPGSRNRLPLRMGRYQIFSGHPFSELSLSCCRLQQNSQRIRQYGISLYKRETSGPCCHLLRRPRPYRTY